MPDLRPLAPLLAVAVLVAGCGNDDVGAKPDLPSETPALWNPCDALDVAFVKAQFGATTTKYAGTASSPECRFAPAKDSGEPALSANYQPLQRHPRGLLEADGPARRRRRA
ncbi:hypothetical protein G5V59_15780 [Nocardioides sp. W3-2-3]|uniref:hypothetical protein n=1 Tax=Nocardioides convexus TaxID=2712224 RepID=UPI002418860C|nr:hypothetical protein [Nocardioides convexus]NHA00886.1 hypothetical protein [Nocardioides convexus]